MSTFAGLIGMLDTQDPGADRATLVKVNNGLSFPLVSPSFLLSLLQFSSTIDRPKEANREACPCGFGSPHSSFQSEVTLLQLQTQWHGKSKSSEAGKVPL